MEIEKKSEQREAEGEELQIEVEDWSEEGIRKFIEWLENVSFEREGVQEGLRGLVGKIMEGITKKRVNMQKRRPGKKMVEQEMQRKKNRIKQEIKRIQSRKNR